MTKVTIDERSPVVHGGHRYFAGETYDVPTDVAGLFKGMGWATSAEKGAEVSEPFVCHDATEEDAKRFAAEAKERLERNARGAQEPDLEVQDGKLGQESGF